MKKIALIMACVLAVFPVFAKEMTGFGINAGVGTDVSLGLAVGAGASYLMVNDAAMAVEAGFNIYFNSITDAYQENGYHYKDFYTTIIYAVVANALFNYDPQKAGIYTLIGLGAGGVSLSWERTSTDDMTWPDSGDDTGGSAIVNFGVGGTFGNGFELRVQLPILITFTGIGGTIFSPALTLGAGLRM